VRTTHRTARKSTLAPFCTLLAAMAALLLVSPASAKKTHLFLETFGSAAKPTFSYANGIAVDPASGDLLVIEAHEGRVRRFKPNGEPDPFPALGTNVIDGKGGGQCATVPTDCDQTPKNSLKFRDSSGNQQIAVDDSGTVTDGNIYVAQPLEEAGDLIAVFAADGHYLGQITAAGVTKFADIQGPTEVHFFPTGLAVDAAGNLYAAGQGKEIFKFDPAANPPVNADHVATFTAAEQPAFPPHLAAGAGSLFATNGRNGVMKIDLASMTLQGIVDSGENHHNAEVAVDPVSGHVYSVNHEPLGDTVTELDASGGVPLASFTASEFAGMAVDGAGRVYRTASDTGQGISVFGPTVTVPDVTTGEATITGDTSATLQGTVNPDGVALEECFFEWGKQKGPPYEHKTPCQETPAEIGVSVKTVHLALAGLEAETLYHYRLAAKNPNATINGADRTLKTPGKPAILAQWATGVGIAEATLAATIVPENSPTTYHLEWGKANAPYEHLTAEKEIGSDTAEHTMTQLLTDLESGTAYHYRFVAANGIGTSEGAEHNFTTFPPVSDPEVDCPNQGLRGGPSAALPDCRAFEMVSPLDKNNGDILPPNNINGFRIPFYQASTDGEGLTYSSYRAFANPQSAPYVNQYLARRGQGGWSSEALSPPSTSATLTGVQIGGLENQWLAFSPDLANAWLFHDAEPPLASGAVEGSLNIYRRDNNTAEYEALSTVESPHHLASDVYYVAFEGASADGAHAVYAANDKLTANAINSTTISQLYEYYDGGLLRLVSVLPNGSPSPFKSTAGASSTNGEGIFGYRRDNLLHAVSEDGSRIFWSTKASNGDEKQLYVRIDGERTVAISESLGSARWLFWLADPAGTKAVFSKENGGGLYEFDVDGEEAHLIAPSVAGVIGASEDASRIYFVSSMVLSGEEENSEGAMAKAAARNIYLYETATESFTYVATLEGTIGIDLDSGVFASEPFARTSRVTPDGLHLAFMSTASLTGYDNSDVASGEADAEVYRYDAQAKQLDCASCNPSGGRPRGVLNSPVRAHKGGGNGWVSSMIPGWQTGLYASRNLSEDGSRLFFESYDALVPHDTNGTLDIYEWEAPEAGACEEESNAYSSANGGCIYLISTGQSPGEAEFVDASPDGKDVFFTTGSGLVPQDYGLIDIYDARAGGGYPPPPNPPAGCEGEACQGAPAPPNDPTPASSAFEGAGNVAKGGKPGRCTKGKVRRKGRCTTKNAKHRHKRAAKHNRRGQR
jgi:DNA-binding beta-propeller fold protein YncE